MYVISYDVSDDKVRSKVAKKLESYGARVQYSVFECRINRKQYQVLYEELAEIIEGDENASIRFYFLCVNCEMKTCVLGNIDNGYTNLDDILVI